VRREFSAVVWAVRSAGQLITPRGLDLKQHTAVPGLGAKPKYAPFFCGFLTKQKIPKNPFFFFFFFFFFATLPCALVFPATMRFSATRGVFVNIRGDDDPGDLIGYRQEVMNSLKRLQDPSLENENRIIAIECLFRLVSSLQADGSAALRSDKIAFHQATGQGLNYHSAKFVELAFVLRMLGDSNVNYELSLTAIENDNDTDTCKPVRSVVVAGKTAQALASLMLAYCPKIFWYQPGKAENLECMCTDGPDRHHIRQVTKKIYGLLSPEALADLSKFIDNNRDTLSISVDRNSSSSSSSSSPAPDVIEAEIRDFIVLRVGWKRGVFFFFFFFFLFFFFFFLF
jgi:hypothetical protein